MRHLLSDHVIVLAPETYSAQELYVALTQGPKSVTIISDPVVLPPPKMATQRAISQSNQPERATLGSVARRAGSLPSPLSVTQTSVV